MAQTRQLAFRLPQDLIGRIHACEEHMKLAGLNVSRTDVVRLLLTYALNTSECDLARLLGRANKSDKADSKLDGKSDGKSKGKAKRKDDTYEVDPA